MAHAKYTALLADIAQARDHIDIEYYIFLPDRTGTALRDALVERARAGVQVRLLLDAVGSSKTPRKFFAPLVEAGGEVAWFHPMRLGRFWRRPWLNLRTHRKIVVIDGHIAYTGGINVTDEEDESPARRCVSRPAPAPGRAHRACAAGGVRRGLGVRDRASADLAATRPRMPRRPGRIAVQAIASGPDSDWEAIHRMFVSARSIRRNGACG